MKHVDLMVDLETFATGPDALIVQIGACYFDRVTGEIFETFKANINPSGESVGQVDVHTVMWWLKQSKAAQESILAEPRVEFKKALQDFKDFSSRANCIWSHATFDFVILQNSFKRCGIRQFNYKSARDIRTLVDLAGQIPQQTRDGVHHDALDDAIFQVKYCVACLNKITGEKNGKSEQGPRETA